jgi:uncharacterized protein YbaR (Trm112 family)
MAVEFVRCPACRQKLAVHDYVLEGSLVVCANPKCDTSLRVVRRKPLRVELVPEVETYRADYRPESYG